MCKVKQVMTHGRGVRLPAGRDLSRHGAVTATYNKLCAGFRTAEDAAHFP